jgi:hypothetical protein
MKVPLPTKLPPAAMQNTVLTQLTLSASDKPEAKTFQLVPPHSSVCVPTAIQNAALTQLTPLRASPPWGLGADNVAFQSRPDQLSISAVLGDGAAYAAPTAAQNRLLTQLTSARKLLPAGAGVATRLHRGPAATAPCATKAAVTANPNTQLRKLGRHRMPQSRVLANCV